MARKPKQTAKPERDQVVEELHAAIDEHPDDAANYQVLADLLIERGDPRGELIQLEGVRAEAKKARALRGKLDPDLNPGCDWKYGYVRHYMEYAGIEAAATIRAQLAHPSLRHVTSIEIELAGSNLDKRQWIVDLIAEELRPALRKLTIRGNDPELEDLSIGPLWTKRLPRLEEVSVNARLAKLGKIESATLAVLHVVAGIDDPDLRPLLTAALPALRELKFEAEEDGKVLAKLRRTALAKRLGDKLIVEPLDTARYDRFVE